VLQDPLRLLHALVAADVDLGQRLSQTALQEPPQFA